MCISGLLSEFYKDNDLLDKEQEMIFFKNRRFRLWWYKLKLFLDKFIGFKRDGTIFSRLYFS